MADKKFLKWSTSNVSNADGFGNVHVSNSTTTEYGPSSTTDFHSNIEPPIGGYTVYYYSTTGEGPSIYTPSTDSELVNIHNQIKGTSFSNVVQVKDDIDEDDNTFLDGDIIRDGLIFYMDPNKDSSYPGTGTAVTNIAPSGTSNGIDGTLDNADMFINPSDGAAYFRVQSTATVKRLEFDSTISRAGNGDSTLMFYFWSNYNASGQYSNSQAFFGGKYTNYMALRGGGGTNYSSEAETNGGSEGNHDYFANEGTTNMAVGEWNSWTSIFDSGTASNYYNGVLNGATYSLNSTSTHSFVRLGSSSTGTGSGDRGGDIRMGAVVLYNRVLSEQEIRYNLSVFDQRYK